MVYLDYSATTPVNKEVLDYFNEVSLNYPGNANSLHSLGFKSKQLEETLTEDLSHLLGIKPSEIIYTSGASESNNLAIKGIALKYQNRGKHIITTMLEHASIFGPLNYLQNLGFEVEFVNLTNQGLVDLDHLKTILRDDTILVSINMVDSEIGIVQPVSEIKTIVSAYPKCFFHSDVTQAMGKIEIDFSHFDLASFSAHKFYGLKGIGALAKKEKIMLEPLIHGGKSTTSFRSGTPALPLIASIVKAYQIINKDITANYEYVYKLNNELKAFLSKYDNVIINSNEYSVPFVINFSIKGIKAETFVHAMEADAIYISTKSACSSSDTISKAVMAVTNDKAAAEASLRISLSYLTTSEELEQFKKSFDKHYQKLLLK